MRPAMKILMNGTKYKNTNGFSNISTSPSCKYVQGLE